MRRRRRRPPRAPPSGSPRSTTPSPRRRVLALLLAIAPLHAQDTRTITEPVIPPSCVTLTAKFTTTDDSHADTARIQSALDRCSPGHAVELQSGAFLTGPIELRSNVTLLIDKDAALYARRNPRDYDVTPNACGIVHQMGHGCKPIISGNNIQHAAVMGDGPIDGRRGEKLTGQNVSW